MGSNGITMARRTEKLEDVGSLEDPKENPVDGNKDEAYAERRSIRTNWTLES